MIENNCVANKEFVVYAVRTPGLSVTYWIQNLDIDATYLYYFNATTQLWQSGFIANTLTESTVPGVYIVHVNHTALACQHCGVGVTEITTSYSDIYTIRFSSVETTVLNAVAPMRKEITRVTDNHMRITCWDALTAGNKTLQIDVTHDSSGAQPEEIQLNTTNQP